MPGAYLGTGDTVVNETNACCIRLIDSMETNKQRVGMENSSLSEVCLDVPT